MKWNTEFLAKRLQTFNFTFSHCLSGHISLITITCSYRWKFDTKRCRQTTISTAKTRISTSPTRARLFRYKNTKEPETSLLPLRRSATDEYANWPSPYPRSQMDAARLSTATVSIAMLQHCQRVLQSIFVGSLMRFQSTLFLQGVCMLRECIYGECAHACST